MFSVLKHEHTARYHTNMDQYKTHLYQFSKFQLVVGMSEPALVPGRIVEYGNRIQEWWDVLKPKVLQAFTRLEIEEEFIHIMDNTLFELGKAANDFKVTKRNCGAALLNLKKKETVYSFDSL